MSWQPTTEFEKAAVMIQPNHDFIFGKISCPRPQHHIDFVNERRNRNKNRQIQVTTETSNSKLKIIEKVQNISRTKKLGEQPTVHDWDTRDTVEEETVAMMRHFGMEVSTDAPLNEKTTIATMPITQDVVYMKSGHKRMPIFFDEKFFKLKPRLVNSWETDDIRNDKMNSIQVKQIKEIIDLNTIVEDNPKDSTISSASTENETENSYTDSKYKTLVEECDTEDNNNDKQYWSYGIFGGGSIDNICNKNRKNKNKKRNKKKNDENTSSSDNSYKSSKSHISPPLDATSVGKNNPNEDLSSVTYSTSIIKTKYLYTPKQIYDMKRSSEKKKIINQNENKK